MKCYFCVTNLYSKYYYMYMNDKKVNKYPSWMSGPFFKIYYWDKNPNFGVLCAVALNDIIYRI